MEIYLEVPKVKTQQGMGLQHGLVFKTQVAYQGFQRPKVWRHRAHRVGHHGATDNCQLQKITERHTSKGNEGDLRSA